MAESVPSKFRWQNMDTSASASAIMATVTELLLVLVHGYVLPAVLDDVAGFQSLDAWRFKLFASGWISLSILWTYLFAIFYLLQIWALKLIPLSLSNDADVSVIQAVIMHNDERLVSALNDQASGGESGYYGQRLARLRQRYQQDQDLAAVQAMKDDILANDEEDIVLSFNAVAWAEWALPMLGFLGTVVGIGEALGAILQGVTVLFSSEVQVDKQEVLRAFVAGFAGLGVAFDTTFLGLTFLLIVGLLKVALKKSLAARLGRARITLFEAVSMWQQQSGGELVQLAALAGLVERSNELTMEAEERSRSFRESIRQMALSVIREDPNLRSVRDVLLRPVVEFQPRGAELVERAKTLGKKNGLTGAAALAGCANDASVFFASGSRTERTGSETVVLQMGTRSAEQDELFGVIAGSGAVLAALSKGQLIFGTTDGRRHLWKKGSSRLQALQFDANAMVYALRLDGRTDGALLVSKQGSITKTALLDAGSEILSEPKTKSAEYDWESCAVHYESGTVFDLARRKADGSWTLHASKMGLTKAAGERGGSDRYKVALPSDVLPKQVVAIGSEQVAILDQQSRLYWWDRSLERPVACTPRGWLARPEARIYAGSGGWIALHDDTLSMWQMHKGGAVYAYEGPSGPLSFHVNALRSDLPLVVAAGGSLALGIDRDGDVIGWDFPVLASDRI